MLNMSDLKPVMVRLPPEVYEKLRVEAFRMTIPPAVLARVLIKQQLEGVDAPEALEEPSPVEVPAPSPSSSRRRSGNSKRRKNKKNRGR